MQIPEEPQLDAPENGGFMLAPAGKQFTGTDQREPLRSALERHGELPPAQTAGRLFAVACVSLEITQRCNLDCTLCYLSSRAEMAKDVPLPVLFDRIDTIESHYGKGTSVQISGGDPTLRKIEALESLCHHIRKRGMRSCLMTNGIKAKRTMLERLASAGLNDVAFHVDLTQERKGYPTEVSLNTIRSEYIKRAQNLGLRILFNTTLYDGNIRELPALASFFREQAHNISLISFQMQADTGRGVLREREDVVTRENVVNSLSKGFDTALDFDAVSVGHSQCNRYTTLLCAGGDVLQVLGNTPLIEDTIAALEAGDARAQGYLDPWVQARRLLFRRPGLMARLAIESLSWLWKLRRGIWRSGGRPHRMSILIHDFMDASKLDRARCESCVFMVATENGPLSMCVHNAERDQHVFTPALMQTENGPRWWDAESGELVPDQQKIELIDKELIPLKKLKGRMRADVADVKNRETV